MNLEELISQDYELTGAGNWLHGIEHSSLVVDLRKQIFYWNSQGISGDAYIWLTKVKNYSAQQAKEYLRLNTPESSFTFISTVRDHTEEVAYPKLVDIFYEEGVNSPRDYWYKRSFTDKTISRFKLGFHDGWYTIPIYQEGLFRNFQLRRDDPKKMIRSYYKGVGRLLFNSDILKIVDDIIITEGPTDALVLLQNGIPAVSHNAGSEGWDEEWFRYFIHQKNIIVNYDNDSAGRVGALRVAKNLGEYRVKLYNFDGFEEKFDIGDFFVQGGTAEEYKELLKKNSKYIFELPKERKGEW
jgi:DNA primase